MGSTSYADGTNFAWIITIDYLYESDKEIFSNEKGRSGPSESPDDLTDWLQKYYIEHKVSRPESGRPVKRYMFTMYDDDGIAYYAGVLVVYADSLTKSGEPDEEALMAPLYDFGGPGAGAVVIKYHNHPNWTMEY